MGERCCDGNRPQLHTDEEANEKTLIGYHAIGEALSRNSSLGNERTRTGNRKSRGRKSTTEIRGKKEKKDGKENLTSQLCPSYPAFVH